MALKHLFMQDSKQPRAELRSPFEAIEPLKECRKNVLDQVFSFGSGEAHRSRGSKEWSRVFLHSFGKGIGLALAKPGQELRRDCSSR
jgi:hypothetical protein